MNYNLYVEYLIYVEYFLNDFISFKPKYQIAYLYKSMDSIILCSSMIFIHSVGRNKNNYTYSVIVLRKDFICGEFV